MSGKFDEKNKFASNAIIKVIGVGGGGGNALNTMIESGLTGVEFIAANTDVQALQANLAPIKIQLGKELTKGLGAGANPETGRNAALEDKAILQEVLSGADMVFVTGGMGGGTGTGAAPIIAQVAREIGALTVGVVTKPFGFEGKRRKQQSELGIQALRQSVDTLITIPNQRLLSIAPPDMSMLEGFKLADEVLLNAVKGISDIINIPGRVNVDFADVKTIMSEMGMALMGIGTGHGPNRASEAARAAINSPLLEDIDIEGATGILINITGTSSMTLHEISEASTLIQEAAHEDANIIFGAVIDENMGDSIRVTVIATGFDQARIAYPEQTHSFTSMPQQSQFMHNNVTAQQQSMSAQPFSSLNSTRTQNSQNMYSQQQNTNHLPHNSSIFEQRMPNQQSNFNTNNIPQNPFARNTQPFQQSNVHTPNFGAQNQQIPITRIQDLNTHSTFRNTHTTPTAPQQTTTSQLGNHSQTANREAQAQSSVMHEQNIQVSQEVRIGASTTTTSATSQTEELLEDNTENALKLAKELSDIEIDEADFETPTFMRKKEEAQRF